MIVQNTRPLKAKFAATVLTVSLLSGGLPVATAAVPTQIQTNPSTQTPQGGGTSATPQNPNTARISANSANQGEQIGTLARKIIKWAKDNGGSIWTGLKSAVGKGWVSVKSWMLDTLPSFLKDVAITIGIDVVAQWIVNNWPY